jgi:hypothetical protein
MKPKTSSSFVTGSIPTSSLTDTYPIASGQGNEENVRARGERSASARRLGAAQDARCGQLMYAREEKASLREVFHIDKENNGTLREGAYGGGTKRRGPAY